MCKGGGGGLKWNHSGLMLQMCLLYTGMSLAVKELTTVSNCSGKQRCRGILKVQMILIKKAFSVFS